MPHQTPDAEKATAQNAATEPQAPRAQGAHGPETEHSKRPEPRAYAAPDSRDATLAAPAAGEVGDYADEGDPLDEDLGEVQMGRNRGNISGKDAALGLQGKKTLQANRDRVKRKL